MSWMNKVIKKMQRWGGVPENGGCSASIKIKKKVAKIKFCYVEDDIICQLGLTKVTVNLHCSDHLYITALTKPISFIQVFPFFSL